MKWLIRITLVITRFLINILVFLIAPKYKNHKFVVVESPFAGDETRNLGYVRECMRDCFGRGELPFASHALYAQPGVLKDNVPEERASGIFAGLLWTLTAEATVVYTDYGISGGMKKGIEFAEKLGREVEYRKLYSD